MAALESVQHDHSTRLHSVEANIFQLQMGAVNAATKSDVASLKSHIDESINQFLTNALQLQPSKEGNKLSKSIMAATWIASAAAIISSLVGIAALFYKLG